jgi:hypothetical protein
VSEVEGWGSPRRVRRALCFGVYVRGPRKRWAPALSLFQIFASLDTTRSRWSLLFGRRKFIREVKEMPSAIARN